jgi:type IV secretory pathway VirB2 component (pilin)
MNGLFRFLASSTGRAARVVAGIVLILVGLVWIQGALGWILVVIGLVPLLAGAFDKCVVAPLFGLPFAGPGLRRVLDEQR